jgi:hypothetical protein
MRSVWAVYWPKGVVIEGVAANLRISASSSTCLIVLLAELAMLTELPVSFQAKPLLVPKASLLPEVPAPR